MITFKELNHALFLQMRKVGTLGGVGPGQLPVILGDHADDGCVLDARMGFQDPLKMRWYHLFVGSKLSLSLLLLERLGRCTLRDGRGI